MCTTEITKTTEGNDLTYEVNGCALEVHRLLGPGLLESAYAQCLAYEFSQIGIAFKAQKSMPLEYKDVKLDCGYRLDFIIADSLTCMPQGMQVSRNADRKFLQSYTRVR